MTKSASGGHGAPGRRRRGRCRRGVPVREPLGPAIVLGKRTDDPQLSGRMREARLQHERALDGAASTGVATTAIPADAGTTTGASGSRSARGDAARRSGSSEPPPVSCSPMGASPVPTTSPSPRAEQPARSRRASSGSQRHPDAAPAAASFALVPGLDVVRDARERGIRLRGRAPALLARRTSAVQERATAISGPRSASHSDSTEPVTSHSTTAPTSGHDHREDREAARGGVGGSGGSVSGSSTNSSGSGRGGGRRTARSQRSRAPATRPSAWQPRPVEKRGQLAGCGGPGVHGDVEHDDRDVVTAAVLERGIEHGRHRVRGIRVLVQEVLDAVVGELFREPVRADHEAVAIDDVEPDVVGRRALARPHGARDDVAVRVVLGLFGAQAARRRRAPGRPNGRS